jgi:AraC-like DNA-binding protein
MQSPIALELVSATDEPIAINELPDFCNWPIPYALTRLITMPEGRIVKQSFSSYLAHIELYEYALNQDYNINYTRDEPSIFMFLMFEGYSALYDREQHLISESPAGAFHMGYINKGRFTAKIKAGRNTALLLTLKADWLLRKTERLAQFRPIKDHFLAAELPMYVLPNCRLTQDILKPVKNLFLQEGTNQDDLEATIDGVVTKLSGQYHELVAEGNYTTGELHRIKAKEIADFILAHYAEPIAEDVANLANQFHLSERQLLRLAKIAFTSPLHRQVIYFRMHYGLKYLMTTKSTIAAIAAAVGYQDEKYFSKAFKKFFGVLPSEIRIH